MLVRTSSSKLHCEEVCLSDRRTLKHTRAHTHMYILIPKTTGNRKRGLCVRLRSGDKHHLRKSADRKAQIRKACVPLTGLICAFRSADFLRWCLTPSATSRTISFSIPIVFGINLIHFSIRRRTVQPEIRFVCFGALIPCHAIGQAQTKNGNCFEEGTFLATESVNSAPF